MKAKGISLGCFRLRRNVIVRRRQQQHPPWLEGASAREYPYFGGDSVPSSCSNIWIGFIIVVVDGGGRGPPEFLPPCNAM